LPSDVGRGPRLLLRRLGTPRPASAPVDRCRSGRSDGGGWRGPGPFPLRRPLPVSRSADGPGRPAPGRTRRSGVL